MAAVTAPLERVDAGGPKAASADAILVVDDIVKRFETPDGVLTAVDHVSLGVAPGEFLGVIGPSGCGKSTLFNVMGGLLDGYDGTVQVWNPTNGNTISNFNGGNVIFCGLAWSPDGQRLAVAGGDNQVRILNASTGQQISAFSVSGLQDVTWSPDGKLLAVGETGQVELFNANSNSHTYTNSGQPGDVTAMTWSPESTRLASGSSKGPVRVWQAV